MTEDLKIGMKVDYDHLAVNFNLPNPNIDNENYKDEQMFGEVDRKDEKEDFNTPGPSKVGAPRVPIRHVRELNKEKEKARRISGELYIEKTNKKDDIEKNVERGIRAELKRRKLHDGEIKIVEVIEKVGNILKVKKTKVVEEKNTGKVRSFSQTQTLVNIITRRPYKKKLTKMGKKMFLRP